MKIKIIKDVVCDSMLPQHAGVVLAIVGDVIDVPDERENWLSGKIQTKILYEHDKYAQEITRGVHYVPL